MKLDVAGVIMKNLMTPPAHQQHVAADVDGAVYSNMQRNVNLTVHFCGEMVSRAFLRRAFALNATLTYWRGPHGIVPIQRL